VSLNGHVIYSMQHVLGLLSPYWVILLWIYV